MWLPSLLPFTPSISLSTVLTSFSTPGRSLTLLGWAARSERQTRARTRLYRLIHEQACAWVTEVRPHRTKTLVAKSLHNGTDHIYSVCADPNKKYNTIPNLPYCCTSGATFTTPTHFMRTHTLSRSTRVNTQEYQRQQYKSSLKFRLLLCVSSMRLPLAFPLAVLEIWNSRVAGILSTRSSWRWRGRQTSSRETQQTGRQAKTVTRLQIKLDHMENEKVR